MLDHQGCEKALNILNPLIFLKVHPEIVVLIDDTFDGNFLNENDFTKYLKESC